MNSPQRPEAAPGDSSLSVRKGNSALEKASIHQLPLWALSLCQADKPRGKLRAILNFLVALTAITIMTGMEIIIIITIIAGARNLSSTS